MSKDEAPKYHFMTVKKNSSNWINGLYIFFYLKWNLNLSNNNDIAI